jgi:hypothetical protein
MAIIYLIILILYSVFVVRVGPVNFSVTEGSLGFLVVIVLLRSIDDSLKVK